jgi:hypothetical protein
MLTFCNGKCPALWLAARLIEELASTLCSGACAELAGQAGVLDQASPPRAAPELAGELGARRE